MRRTASVSPAVTLLTLGLAAVVAAVVTTVLSQVGGGVPTPGGEGAPSPLGTPRPPAFRSDAYAFLATQDDGRTPVAWDPCRPVHYVVRPDGAPPGGDAVIEAAVARVSSVTGLVFVPDGATDETPSDRRAAYQPGRYGDRWAPVLVAWQDAAQNPAFAGEVIGQAGPQQVQTDGEPAVYVSGQVALDAVRMSALMREDGGAAVAEAVVLHELGHLVGLDHVDASTEVMYPQADRVITQLGPGDLTGLAALGSGVCAPWL